MYQPPKKKGKLPIIIGIVVALVVFACIGSALASKGGTTTTTSTDTTTTQSTQQQPTSAPTTAPTPIPTMIPTPTTPPTPIPTVASGPAKIGQTITVNGVSCTLLKVGTIPDDDLGLLKAGNEWVVVTVKLVNNSGQDYEYMEYDFSIISGSGNATSPDIPPSTYTANNEMSVEATLTNGGSTTGDIIFQAPVGDHKAELSWKPSYSSGTTDNVWLLGL
jgi:hypothetical protein